MRITLLLIALLCASISNYGQERVGDNKKLDIKLRPVNGNTYILKGNGPNLGVHVGENEVLIVDTHSPKVAGFIIERLGTLTDNPIKYVVNTSFKKERTSGNIQFKTNGATIIAHQNLVEAFSSKKNRAPQEAFPNITFNERMDVYLGGEKIELLYAPNAHTDSDAMVYIPSSNVLITGNAFLTKLYPVVDVENGGTYRGAITAMDMIMAMDKKNLKILPGNGAIGTMNDVENSKIMLLAVIKNINNQYKLGKTEDEVAAMDNITAAYDSQGYGDGAVNGEQLRRSIYKEIVKKDKKETDKNGRTKSSKKETKG